MKIPVPGSGNGQSATGLSLQQLVNHLLLPLESTRQRQKSSITNDVPGDFLVHVDENLLASVMNTLFSTVIRRSNSGNIRISAKAYNDIVLVQVKDSNHAQQMPVTQELEQAQPLAEKLGGCITMNGQRSNEAMVTFSFFSPSVCGN